MKDPALKFAFALDGLIRARTKGHGGEDFARKCILEIAESLREMTVTHEFVQDIRSHLAPPEQMSL